MSGTGIAYGANIVLWACYAMSITNLAYAHYGRPHGMPTPLAAYALAMQCPVLTQRLVLPAYALATRGTNTHVVSPTRAAVLKPCMVLPGGTIVASRPFVPVDS
eukprot:449213-Rhodomonas_salina.1